MESFNKGDRRFGFYVFKRFPASFVAKGLEEQWWGGGAGHKTRRVLRRVL